MKENENFDNTFFMKILCVIAAVILVCVVIFVIIGAINGTAQDPAYTDDQGYEPSFTFAPDESKTPADTTGTPDAQTTPAPNTTAVPADTTAAPVTPADTTAPPSETTAAPADTTAPPAGTLTPLPSSPLILPESPDAGMDYQNSIVFLGDSTTYGLIAYKMLEGGKNTTQVWTPITGTLTLDQAVKKTIVYPETGEEITASAAAALKKPAYLIITLGVNGVSFMNEEQFITEYKKLVQSIQAASPETKIILQSIYPVARNYENLAKINNEKITLANTWVLKVAEQCGLKFLNTATVLRDSEGWLMEKYTNGDGMHLSADGFNVVLSYIRTHAYTE